MRRGFQTRTVMIATRGQWIVTTATRRQETAMTLIVGFGFGTVLVFVQVNFSALSSCKLTKKYVEQQFHIGLEDLSAMHSTWVFNSSFIGSSKFSHLRNKHTPLHEQACSSALLK